VKQSYGAYNKTEEDDNYDDDGFEEEDGLTL
jgi:hypothetical protein